MSQIFLQSRTVLLGLLLSSGSFAIFGHGLLGTGSLVTGFLIAVPTVALILLGDWKGFAPNQHDALFGLFVCLVVTSMSMRGSGAAPKDFCLLALSLAAYPAARLNAGKLDLTGLMVVIGVVTLVGTLVTIPALASQWQDQHGKPFVFGEFDSAPLQFSSAMSLFAFVMLARGLSRRSLIFASLLIAIPTAVFAASMVRFSLLALVATLVLAAAIGPRGQRKPIMLMLGVVVVAIVVGLAVRFQATSDYLGFTFNSIDRRPPMVELEPFANCPAVDPNNSMAIRWQLYADAMTMLPRTGLFGIGFGEFARASCITGSEVHNSFLQWGLEFGWPAGFTLVALFALGLGQWWRMRGCMCPALQFALYGLLFSGLIACVYGASSRDSLLFLFLGYVAGLEFRLPRLGAGWKGAAPVERWVASCVHSGDGNPGR
jgi:O-antigen ligase